MTAENPRQKLLEVIADKGPITIKELKQETGMSTGSLYHHISRLGEYLMQDQQKRYMLSERGRMFFTAKHIIQLPVQPWYASFMLPVMRNRYSSIITIVAVLQLYIIIYASSGQLMMLPVKYGGIAESVALGWVLSVLTAEGLSITAGARPVRGILALASGISVATVPVTLFSLLPDQNFAIPIYALALFIASSAISGAKNISYASSIPVALSILMVSIVLFTASLGTFIIIPVAIIAAIMVMARLGYFDIVADALSH